MIFISGIHGVGKSFFCKMVKEKTGIDAYSASDLIAQKKAIGFKNDKLISDIDENQLYLLQAVDELRASRKEFLLDGHFCLLNANGRVTRVPRKTFISLKPDAIILLLEKPAVIAARRKERDGIDVPEKDIQYFQEEESAYAKEIAAESGVTLFVSNGQQGFLEALAFIMSH